MLVSKKNRLQIYSYLFKEGVVVAAKNLLHEHKDIGVPNLEVVKLMLSLRTRGYVKENFCWSHHYFTLTDEGLAYLREYLHLPEHVIPATLKKSANAPEERPRREGKDGGAGGDFKPSFRREGAAAGGDRRRPA